MRFSDFQVGDYVAFPHIVTSESFEPFACVSGDRNRLHWCPEFSSSTPFGTTIAPLFLSVQPFSAIAGMAFPGVPSLILSQHVEAVRPVRYGEPLTYSGRIERILPSERVLVLSLVVVAGKDIAIRGRLVTKALFDEWERPGGADGEFQVLRLPRLAAVTGAAGAIGSATVRALALAGWEVVPVCRSTPGGAERAVWASARGRVLPAIAGDLCTDAGSAHVAAAIAELGPTLIVHCASAPYPADTASLVSTNYSSLESIMQACLPAFLSRQAGRVVFLGSLAQRTHPSGAFTYAAAKEMTSHYLAGLNHRYGSCGLRAVTLMSDRVRSSFSAGLAGGSGVSLEPEEVAAAIVELADHQGELHDRYVVDGSGMYPAENTAASTGFTGTGRGAAPGRPAAEPVATRAAEPEAEALRRIFSRVLPRTAGVPDAKLRLGQADGWDSLAHITLMLEIETVFGISLSTHDISSVTSFEDTLKLVKAQVSGR